MLALAPSAAYFQRMKLLQGQTWQKADAYYRIVHLERLEVRYKTFRSLDSRDGTHHHVTKKDFCRLIKGAVLLARDGGAVNPPPPAQVENPQPSAPPASPSSDGTP